MKKNIFDDKIPQSDCSSLKIWQDNIAIQQVSANDIISGWQSNGMPAYSLLLVYEGALAVEYNGKFMEINAGDLYFYAPGMPTRMVSASNDYHAYLLLIEEQTVVRHPMLSLFLKAAYIPVAEFKYPKISLTKPQIDILSALFISVLLNIDHSMEYQEEVLFRLCESIAMNVTGILHQQIAYRKVSTRSEELFAHFLQLVPQHAARHHDLSFYARQLNITTTYLSRIVRSISGRTVMSFLEYAITNEAIRLLKTTDMSITDIAFRLNFSDQSSFSKFFTRQKGMSALSYRKQHCMEAAGMQPMLNRL